MEEAFESNSGCGSGKHSSIFDVFVIGLVRSWYLPQRFDEFEGEFNANSWQIKFYFL